MNKPCLILKLKFIEASVSKQGNKKVSNMVYAYHLNYEALHKSTAQLKNLLNKYRQKNKYVEEAYQSLQPLFDQIKTNKKSGKILPL